MCGIVGIAGNTFANHTKMFKDLLVLDQLRGFDSTGVMFISGISNIPAVEKAVGTPENLWMRKDCKLMDHRGVPHGLPRVMLGHNRAATFGDVTAENAHPFTHKHITGVHNGSLRDWYDLENFAENDVDSLSLIQTIAERGIDDTWKSFTGAAAIVFWDAKEGTLNFIRNDERPLYIGHNIADNLLYWASEPWMIRVAASRNKASLKDEKNDIFQLKAHHLHTYKPTATSCELLEVRELEKKKVVTIIGRGYTGGSVGFPSVPSNRRRFKSTRTKNSKVNPNWAKGTEKLGKESKGINLRLVGVTDKHEFVGETVDTGHKIIVFPENDNDFFLLDSYVGEDTVFTTTARVRVSYKGKEATMKISSAHIKVIMSSVKDDKDDEPEDKSGILYRGPQGQLLTKQEWLDLFQPVGKAFPNCAWCGLDLYPQKANQYAWLGNDDCLCEECKEDPNVKNQLSGYYGVGLG